MATISAGENQIDVVEAIIQYSKGFICGESNGIVSLYNKLESGEFHYKKVLFSLQYFLFVLDIKNNITKV